MHMANFISVIQFGSYRLWHFKTRAQISVNEELLQQKCCFFFLSLIVSF